MEDEAENSSFLDGLISPDTRRRTREQTQPLIDILCSPLCVRSAILTVGSALLILTTLLIAISLTQPIDDDFTKRMEMQSVPLWMLDHVTDTSVRVHLKTLAADVMEGRGTGTRGELIAVDYIASHFAMAGLVPVNNGSYFQAVPLASVTPIHAGPLTLGPITLTYPETYTVSTDLLTVDTAIINAAMIFVGYGIIAPAYNWDDYKNVDVTGKVVVVLVNEPLDSNDNTLFAGDTLTYYGRWTYKFEQARAKGALGVVLIHTTETAGYGWQVVANSFAGEQVMLTNPPVKNPLQFKGWITENAAKSLASLNGNTLDGWMSAARSRQFIPVTLQTRFNHTATYSVRYFSGTNVVARLGPSPLNSDTETVIMMAHHDHLGIKPSSGTSAGADDIYNGAVDNASGVAALIASAYAFGSLYRPQLVVAPELDPNPPRRSILFVSLTGEESNLLGSTYFTSHSPCGSNRMCGAISGLNYDIMNVWGKTADMVAIGYGMSSYMDELVLRACEEEHVSVVPDPTPNLGHMFRSDQLPFALEHVPSITLSSGTDYIGRSSNYYKNVTEAYIAEHYHQPSDEYDPNWSMAGVIQQTRIMLRIAYRLATAEQVPKIEDSELLPPPIDSKRK